jgi:N-6 DNA Methylase
VTRTRSGAFTTIRTEGGLLSGELLTRVAAGDATLRGLRAEDYHLAHGERVGEMVTRSWNRLTAAWKGFAETLAALPESEATATSLTRERWLLVLFAELGFGRLQAARTVEVDGKVYRVSHEWASVPIHLIGAKVDLDRRTRGVPGAAGASPHALVQELLNRSEERLWGMVSNGRRLRLLRDNASLTRQAFVEFDLETMLADEVFDDFVVLWLLCHQSRVEGDPTSCWLERWSAEAAAAGIRALDMLRGGVENAIAALGGGFLAHPANSELRERLRLGALSTQDFYRQLLRNVYRLLFLFVAEDRALLHHPTAPEKARRRYTEYYSLARLRGLAGRRRGGPHPDLWRGLQVVFRGLGTPAGVPALGLPALGGFLWSPEACPDLEGAELANRHLLATVFPLAWIQDRDGKVLRPVHYRNLGAEELGSVYESLLEQHPELNVDAATFTLTTAAGNERKTTGSYYTPTSLIVALLDSVLDPVLNDAAMASEPESAILNLKVLDPACGSGHFLIAAAHRIAKRLAAVRTGEEEPPPEAIRTAVRHVISHCIHGVDVNPMAVELCKVSLWMEALEPGRPLSFLDHHIVCGNSLLGTTPALLAGGIPDDAFKPLEGDDRKVVAALRKRNRAEVEGQGLLLLDRADDLVNPLTGAMAELDALGDEELGDVEEKQRRYVALQASAEAERARLVADAWCTAFVIPKRAGTPILTQGVIDSLSSNPTGRPAVLRFIDDARNRYSFLHPHLAFPHIFRTPHDGPAAAHLTPGWSGGFDVVLGNPPWEQTQLEEREFFATRAPEIATAAGADRKRRIAALEHDDPALYGEFRAALRRADGISHLTRWSGRYPFTGRGRVNTYALFAEAMRSLLAPTGRCGVIVPTGIATDDTTKHFFADLINRQTLVSLYDFENTLPLFPAVDRRFKFCLLTITGPERPTKSGAEFMFFAHQIADLDDQARRFTLSAEDLALLNPNTRTCPLFRSSRDAELIKAIYRRVPVLIAEDRPDGNPWEASFRQGLFNMTSDSGLFRSAAECETAGGTLDGNVYRSARGQEWLPLYEAKMVHHFTHRWGDYAMRSSTSLDSQLPDISSGQLADPFYFTQPRYWVAAAEVKERLTVWNRPWLVGFRGITNATNERTVIASILPFTAVGNSISLVLVAREHRRAPYLAASLASFALDFVARFKVGGSNLNFFIIQQLPVLPPETYDGLCPWQPDLTIGQWLAPRILELTYTAWDLAGFAADIGYSGAPFRWDDERREQLRAELDACFFHLYGIERNDVGYIMDTFPILRRNDKAVHGEYRTKRLILSCFEAMAKASISGEPYRTVLVPSPAHPAVAHSSHS